MTVAALAPACSVFDPKRDVQSELALDVEGVLTAFFGADRMDDVRSVGAAYSDRFENNGAYADDLRPVLDVIDAASSLDQAVTNLDAAFEADLATTHLLVVDGWQLGATEARLAGLADYIH